MYSVVELNHLPRRYKLPTLTVELTELELFFVQYEGIEPSFSGWKPETSPQCLYCDFKRPYEESNLDLIVRSYLLYSLSYKALKVVCERIELPTLGM